MELDKTTPSLADASAPPAESPILARGLEPVKVNGDHPFLPGERGPYVSGSQSGREGNGAIGQ